MWPSASLKLYKWWEGEARRCPTGFPRSLDLAGGDLRGEMGHMPVILRCDGAQKFSRLLDIGDVRLHFLITRSR
jgi:hypothetical protein